MARRPLRDCVVWVFVIGGHVLLLVLLSRAGSQYVRSAESRADERSTLLVIELRVPQEEELPTASRQETSKRAAKRDADEARASDSAITVPAPAPPVDWYLEAEAAARARIAKETQPGPRAFGEQPKSPYRKCKSRESSFVWNAEPDKAGFAGGLPFVRLGKRCIIGLGFFGCGIGKLPEANGELFADMHDPDQPVSSVPELEDCRP